MSCDWNVHCLDCEETNRFCDANHRDDLMQRLCKHAAAIAALAPLIEETRDEVELKICYGDLDPAWFAKHAGHRLVPIDEYGRIHGLCGEFIGHDRPCRRVSGHAGDHSPIHQDSDPAFGDPIQLSSEEWRTLCLASETPRILPPSVLNIFAKRK